MADQSIVWVRFHSVDHPQAGVVAGFTGHVHREKTNRRGDSVGSLAAAALRGFIERLAGVPGHVQACVT